MNTYTHTHTHTHPTHIGVVVKIAPSLQGVYAYWLVIWALIGLIHLAAVSVLAGRGNWKYNHGGTTMVASWIKPVTEFRSEFSMLFSTSASQDHHINWLFFYDSWVHYDSWYLWCTFKLLATFLIGLNLSNGTQLAPFYGPSCWEGQVNCIDNAHLVNWTAPAV